MSSQIQVRAARHDDRETVAAFTQNTFRWGDYIAGVWDQWLGDAQGQLLVAELNGQVVGLLHVALVGNREAWMEGMRVHPEFRRLGVAAQLDAAGQALARRAGCRVARLATALENVNAQAAIEHFGYHRCVSFREWDVPAQAGEVTRVRAASARELQALAPLWEHSGMRRTLHGLLPLVEGWRWVEFTRPRLRPWLDAAKVYVTPMKGEPRGFAFVNEEEEGLAVLLVVGQTRETIPILTDLRKLAHQRGKDKYWLILPDTPRTAAWAQAGDWGPQTGGMFLYEASLTTGRQG